MSEPGDLAEALQRHADEHEARLPAAATTGATTSPALGTLVLPYSAQASAATAGGSDGASLRPALVVLAGVALAWLILIGGLAGIGFVLLKLLDVTPSP